jgi:hypothetical protein
MGVLKDNVVISVRVEESAMKETKMKQEECVTFQNIEIFRNFFPKISYHMSSDTVACSAIGAISCILYKIR